MAEAVMGYAEAGMRMKRQHRGKRLRLKSSADGAAKAALLAADSYPDGASARPMEEDKLAGRLQHTFS
jgi:hypothetical protein